MPTGYVKKLSKKHGVSTSTGEKHWAMAKAAAKKQGHGEDYGYITSIFKNMMHEQCFIPTLKDLTNGMTFKYFLVAEAEAEMPPAKEHSFTYKHLADRFPQFNELSFKSRRELEKDANELLDNYDSLDQEEKDSVDDYLHDMVIDKMQAEVGTGAMMGDWKGEAEYQRREEERKAAEAEAEAEKAAGAEGGGFMGALRKKRMSAGPRHIAAMRNQHIPTDRAAEAPAGSNEIGAPVKSYYKPWSAKTPEQLAKAVAHAKKHGTMYRVKNSNWFRAMSPEQQQAVVSALRGGADVMTAKAAATKQ